MPLSDEKILLRELSPLARSDEVICQWCRSGPRELGMVEDLKYACLNPLLSPTRLRKDNIKSIRALATESLSSLWQSLKERR